MREDRTSACFLYRDGTRDVVCELAINLAASLQSSPAVYDSLKRDCGAFEVTAVVKQGIIGRDAVSDERKDRIIVFRMSRCCYFSLTLSEAVIWSNEVERRNAPSNNLAQPRLFVPARIVSLSVDHQKID